MKVVVTGTRVSTFASFLLVGACMAGEHTADKAELGADPADGTSSGSTGGEGAPTITDHFRVTPLTSDQPGVAPNLDPMLKDVWGVTSLEEQFWAVAQETGNLIGLQPSGAPTVHIPLVAEGQPASKADKTITGIAVNDSDQILMDIGGNCGMARAIVAAQSGKLWGVSPDISQTSAFVLVDRSNAGAQYTGVALIHPPTAGGSGGDDGHGAPPPAPTLVLAVDFHNGRVDVFNESFRRMTTGPQFTIPNLPTNFAPFGIFATDDRVILTAAQRRGSTDGEPNVDQQVPGDGLGIVAAFDLTGKLLWRTQSSMFNIPWGMAMGDLRLCATGALLVAQHGDDTRLDGPNNRFGGAVIAMDLRTGKVVSPLLDGDTQPARVQGLWGLSFATGITNIDEVRLHMGAGPVAPGPKGQREVEHGLFARLDMRTP